MEWRPSKAEGVPIYKQIAYYMETRIFNGEYPPGGSLPSERFLASEMGVNRSTIISAYDELHAVGLVKRVKGIGTIVSPDVYEEGPQKRVPNWEQYVRSGFFQINNPINQQIYRIIQSKDEMINFAIGDLSMDLQPISLLQSIHRSMEISQYLGYEHLQGNIKLRESISAHLQKYREIETTPSSIIITSGAQQALHLIIQCLLKPGDAVAIEDPSYAYSLPIFHSAGLKTYFLPTEPEGIDPEHIISLYKRNRIKMVFLNPTFQNPTGTTMTMERKQKIIEISTKYGIPIVEDDPYSITGYDHQPVATLKSMDRDGAVLYISSLSKIVASGLRIGWIVGPQSVINRLTDAKQQIDFGHPNYPQWIAAQLLSSDQFDDHLKQLRIGLQTKRDLTIGAFKKELDGWIEFQVPAGGIHLWCKMNEEWDEKALFKEAIQNGMIYAPGSTLGSKPNYLRFTYSRTDTHQIEEGIGQFAAAVKRICK
ncbi:PLP-dependent aminotransferase family protein [Paenibacillus beijingensis]|uniref:GntR family transcriptional regulator n=1 Tax=Paenibacillus beijingensis TaxID=1126833 RepID=A0A0D5NPU4_9BACL|nr:PLP-dependent aminotransferase family protein [Paenibacillus beijingensis]AJY77329.1 GntR family transcriptional regulator [Paenibacillus beijingensis]